MTMPAAPVSIAVWIDGSWAAAVSEVPEDTTCLSPIAVREIFPPWSAMTSYGLTVSFGMK